MENENRYINFVRYKNYSIFINEFFAINSIYGSINDRRFTIEINTIENSGSYKIIMILKNRNSENKWEVFREVKVDYEFEEFSDNDYFETKLKELRNFHNILNELFEITGYFKWSSNQELIL